MEEVGMTRVTWRKSTRSNGSGDCVEVADGLTDMVGLRDSKDPNGPVLTFDPQAWARFVAGVRHDSFIR
ncbi:DUF397 domain-containing protein [Micromonospora sp. B11E3]|uniref:DUF397 domain-containing protein n=1 Tax=Micromonospora sp. B11E3 TaxID=3153562 RepID=UPI00325F64E9